MDRRGETQAVPAKPAEANREGAFPVMAARVARFLNSSAGVVTIIVAVALTLFVFQIWGWLAAILLMWLSGRWSTKTKLIVTAIVPGAYLLANFFPGIAVGYAVLLLIAPAPFVSALILWRRTI